MATGINDVTAAGNLYDLKDLAELCAIVGEIDYDTYIVTAVSDLTIERGNGEKAAGLKTMSEGFERVKGTVEFTGNTISSGKFADETLQEFMSGDMYKKINEYFGDLPAGTLVKYSAVVDFTSVYKFTSNITEIKEVYANTNYVIEKLRGMIADVTVTINDKTISIHQVEKLKAEQKITYAFSEELTIDSATPLKAFETIVTDVDVDGNEVYADVGDDRYSLDFDKDMLAEKMKMSDHKDEEIDYRSYTDEISISPTDYTKIVDGYHSDKDAAKQYLIDKGIEHSEDYSKLDEIVNDSLSSGKSSSNNTVFIIIGAVAAVIVVGAVAFFVFKKKSA